MYWKTSHTFNPSTPPILLTSSTKALATLTRLKLKHFPMLRQGLEFESKFLDRSQFRLDMDYGDRVIEPKQF